ncbi:hypothetical protein ACFWGD_06605 [Corynebacterium sp. NPDC060344]|uniref:hypothetical protein n=1 Tax=Corynebacterium sp. NPDC060344 TaxID=3347101 RepID=UPI003669B462
MSHQTTKAAKFGRLATATVAAGLAATMLGFGTPAAAAPLKQPVEGYVEGLVLEDIAEACEQNSVTINIKKDLPADLSAAGYTFSIYRVQGIDVTTEAGREEGRGLSVVEAGKRTDPKADATRTTGEEGTVVFEGLPTGMYLVAGRAPEGERYKGYSPIPFTIFLPTGGVDADGDATGWVCDTDLERKLEDPDKPPPSTPGTPPSTPGTPPTSTPGKPPTTKPGTPPTKTTPGQPPTTKTTPGAPGPSGGGGGGLPLTGVSVIGALVIAAGMVAAGIALRRRSATDKS